MIICYFDFVDVSIFPTKADSPLIVDSDAILSPAVAFQSLKAVARRNSQIVQMPSTVKI